jgi:adenine-specific DNA-methyltransferase
MNFNILNPRKSLNKAFLKVKPSRSGIEAFKSNLIYLIDNINSVHGYRPSFIAFQGKS